MLIYCLQNGFEMQNSLSHLLRMLDFKQKQPEGLTLIPLPELYKKQSFCSQRAANVEREARTGVRSTSDRWFAFKRTQKSRCRAGSFHLKVEVDRRDNRKSGQKNHKALAQANARVRACVPTPEQRGNFQECPEFETGQQTSSHGSLGQRSGSTAAREHVKRTVEAPAGCEP